MRPGQIGRALRAAVAAMILAAPVAARAETGREAFERQDYAAAQELWRAEAAEGSAEAEFGLGLIQDLGLGVPRNSSAAMRWYLEAAGQGFADAEFNVAVMLDAGTGVPRDPAAAATWYARAAANGHARAQYNLAMLYQDGIGVPQSDDLARAWYEVAASSLAAATAKLAQLPPDGNAPSGTAVAQPITGAIVGPAEAPRAELVWVSETAQGGFRIEVARRPAEGEPGEGNLLATQDWDLSAVVLDLPAEADDLLWRVARLDGAALTWSPWQSLTRNRGVGEPLDATTVAAPDQLTIYVAPGDTLASAFATELSGIFGTGGVEVTIRTAARPAPATRVSYRHPEDAALAAAVAAFLPALGPGAAVQDPGLDATSGEVAVELAGGPCPAGAGPDCVGG